MAASKAKAVAAEDADSQENTQEVPCTNCGKPAEFTLGDNVNLVNYCGSCLPAHFISAASAGEFPLRSA